MVISIYHFHLNMICPYMVYIYLYIFINGFQLWFYKTPLKLCLGSKQQENIQVKYLMGVHHGTVTRTEAGTSGFSRCERFFVISHHGRPLHACGQGDPDQPLKWWKVCHFSRGLLHHCSTPQKAHEKEFPTISHIAQDFLAIPGASVSDCLC